MSSLRNLIDAMRNGRLLAVLFGHMTVDSYVGVLPILYPVLIGRFHVNLATVGLVSLFYTGVASLSQPLFGYVADRIGTRLIGGAMLWSAAWFAVLGFTPTFATFAVAAGIAGLGSGFFHPLGAVTVRHALPARGRNVAMALYTSGGTVGVALGPLIGATILMLLGLHGTILLLLPGVACSIFLFLWMRGAGHSAPSRIQPAASVTAEVRRALPLIPILATVVMMMSRSWTTITLEAFIPTWYHSLGYQSWFYAPLATTVILASALGTVGCGSLADRFGRRAVVIGCLILSIPAILLFALFPGPAGIRDRCAGRPLCRLHRTADAVDGTGAAPAPRRPRIGARPRRRLLRWRARSADHGRGGGCDRAARRHAAAGFDRDREPASGAPSAQGELPAALAGGGGQGDVLQRAGHAAPRLTSPARCRRLRLRTRRDPSGVITGVE